MFILKLNFYILELKILKFLFVVFCMFSDKLHAELMFVTTKKRIENPCNAFSYTSYL